MSASLSASSTHSVHPKNPPWLGLCVLLLAAFVTIFDLFVVNVAIPQMQASLSASLAQIGAIVAGYELAFGVLLITGGRLGDRFGRRRLFMVGMAGFTVTSAMCGLAPGAEWLIGARIAQGLAAALLFPQVYAAIRVGFQGDDARRAFSWLGMTLGLAAIAGQILGGWLVHANWWDTGWRMIFFINVPIGLLAMSLSRLIPESRVTDSPRLDAKGVVLISLALTLLLLPLLEGPSQGWPIWCLASLVLSVFLLAGFAWHEEWRRKAGELPLVDMQLLRQPRFAQGCVLVLLIYSTASSFFLCFALLVQSGLGLDAFLAGSIFAPCSVGFVVASLAAPRLVARWGSKAIAWGSAFYALALAALIAQVALAGGDLVAAQMIPVLVLVGAGQGIIMTPLINLLLGFVQEAQAGMASGVIATLQQVGAALGVAVVGMLLNSSLAAVDGSTTTAALYAQAFVGAMRFNLIAAVAAAVLLAWLARTRAR